MKVLYSKCQAEIYLPEISVFLAGLLDPQSEVQPLPGILAGWLWPEYEDGRCTSERYIALSAADADPVKQWVCNVRTVWQDEPATVDRLKKAVASFPAKVGWFLIIKRGGMYPALKECDAAWSASGVDTTIDAK